MLVPYLISKIHRATVTGTDLEYVGSISIDENLMKEANLRENQQVEIYNITNGNRLSTYVLTGEAGSGEIQLNGAAAHLVSKGDMIIIAAYAMLDERELNSLNAVVLVMNPDNTIQKVIQRKL